MAQFFKKTSIISATILIYLIKSSLCLNNFSDLAERKLKKKYLTKFVFEDFLVPAYALLCSVCCTKWQVIAQSSTYGTLSDS